MPEAKPLYAHAWDKEQKLLGSVASRVHNLPTMTLHLSHTEAISRLQAPSHGGLVPLPPCYPHFLLILPKVYSYCPGLHAHSRIPDWLPWT